MSIGVFEVLASEQHDEEIATQRGQIVMRERVQRFAKFLEGKSGSEFDSRIELLIPEINSLVSEVAHEYPGVLASALQSAAYEVLAGGHKPGCDCGFCANKGKLPGTARDETDEPEEDSEEKESSVKTAFDYPDGGSIETKQADPSGPGGPIGEQLDEKSKGDNDEELGGPIGDNASGKKGASVSVSYDWDKVARTVEASFCDCSCDGCKDGGGHCESKECIATKRSEASPLKPETAKTADVDTGDTFTQETVSLPGVDDSLGSDPSPKIDKSQVPEGGLKPIDVPSKQHPVEVQDLGTDTPDYFKELPGPSETGKSISADTPLQPEHNVADNTDTWTGTDGFADPVTQKESKWIVLPAGAA